MHQRVHRGDNMSGMDYIWLSVTFDANGVPML